MPRKTSNKRSNNKRKTRKQKLYIMRGCSKNAKSCKNKKLFSSLGNKACPKCGPNCHCGPNCKCPHKCPGNCYLNRPLKGGSSSSSGCGSCGCPIAPYPMNGGYPLNEIPPATAPLNYGEILGTGQNGGAMQNGGTCTACGQVPVTSSTQSGGNFFKPIGPMPGPVVGSSWGASLNKWPGVNDIGGDRNYLKSYDANNNIIGKDPQLQMSMNDAGYNSMYSKVGGYRYGSKPSTSSTSSNTSSSNTTSSNTLSDSDTNANTNTYSMSNSNRKSKSKRRTKSNYNSVKGGGLVPQDLVNLGSDFTFNLKSAYNALNGYAAPVDPLPYKGQLNILYNNGRPVF